MELRHIEMFLVLTEELHFGRTAERLHVSPAAVSQTIRAMERRVGGRLFDRTSRRVVLTSLGERLRDDLRGTYGDIERAFDGARDAAMGLDGELRLCIQSFAAAGHGLVEICTRFDQLHPACRLIVTEGGVADGYDGLRSGAHHLLATWLPHSQEDVVVGPTLAREERMLAVRQGHPLAERGWATAEDLADHPTIAGSVANAPIIPRNTPAGRPVGGQYHVHSMMEAMLLIARGLVVHPTVASTPRYYAHPDIVLIPLVGLPPLESALVWPRARESAALAVFVRVTRDVLGTRFDQP